MYRAGWLQSGQGHTIKKRILSPTHGRSHDKDLSLPGSEKLLLQVSVEHGRFGKFDIVSLRATDQEHKKRLRSRMWRKGATILAEDEKDSKGETKDPEITKI